MLFYSLQDYKRKSLRNLFDRVVSESHGWSAKDESRFHFATHASIGVSENRSTSTDSFLHQFLDCFVSEMNNELFPSRITVQSSQRWFRKKPTFFIHLFQFFHFIYISPSLHLSLETDTRSRGLFSRFSFPQQILIFRFERFSYRSNQLKLVQE